MKKILLLLLILLAFGVDAVWAQERRITGRVLDETGQGLPGAGITVKGTTVGTVTDIDGNFQLNVPEGSNTLVIQAIGYSTQEVSANANTVVRMQTAAKELQGAVVTALAIRREKRELGYSATTLSTDELNGGNNVSALSAIQGKTAGVNITSSTGGPGGSTRVVLRGEKSIGGNNNALIVIDGIPVSNGSRLAGRNTLSQIDYGNRGNDVNPEDIESITVLKGPAAAALYGSAGANGAIMITTKSGRSSRKGPGKTEITYQTNYTLSNVLRFPELQNSYGQGNIYDGIPDDRRENFSWGLPFDGKLRPWGQVINGISLVKPYVAQPDNIKSFYNVGRTWENNVSVGGATEKSTFYLSLNSLNNKGVTPYTYYDKYSVRFNGSTQLSNKFYSSINVNYINIAQRVEQQGQRFGSVWENVIQTPRDIPLWEAEDTRNPYYGYGFKDESGVERFGYYNLYALNPWWVAENYDNRARTDRFLGNIIVGYKPHEDFEIFNRFGGDIVADRITNKIPKYSYQAYDDFYAGINDPQSNGGLFELNVNGLNFFNDVIAQYHRRLSEDFNLDVLLGNSVTLSRTNTTTADINPESNGLVIPGYYSFTNAQGPVQVNNANDNPSPIVESRGIGIYGSIKLGYRNALFLEMTGRNDWSSTLAPGKRSFFYPSANLSWVFTETFKDNNFTDRILTYGKLRAGYASVGNSAVAYQNNNPGYIRGQLQTAFGSTELPFNSIPGYTFQNVIGNPDLRPERTNSWEIGADLGFFRDRITLEATYYQNYSIDQILTVPIAPSSGYTGRVINLGDISNKGIELSLRVVPISQRNGLRWEIYGTYYKNESMVERLAGGVTQVSFGGLSGMTATATVGKPFGALYGTDLLRDGQGRVIIDSATGLPQIGPNPVYRGSYQPRFIASWGTTLRYKGFTFNILFDTKQGGVFYSSTKDLLDFVGSAKETEDREEKVFPNSVYENYLGELVPNTNIKYSPYQYFTNTIPAGQHIVDASYVKLREASLDYMLPESMLKRTPFGNISLGIYGNNLAIWTAEENKYIDPEVNSQGSTNLQGFDFRARSSLRNYGIRLRVSF